MGERLFYVKITIKNGIPSRFPDLKIIIGHLGGAIPMLIQRMDNLYEWEWQPQIPIKKPSVAVKRMWYDSVSHAYLPALRAAIEAYGVDKILLGIDFPYQPVFKHAIDYIKEGLSEEDAKKILDENAARIFNISKTN